tara:strand:- start:21 stop:437 length:417 start_codon:yes stop_codon:yes gene_type:complete
MSNYLESLKKKKINIIPLIDIIFILLIFFMLATNFRVKENIDFSITENITEINNNQENKILEIFVRNNSEISIKKKIIRLENRNEIAKKIRDVFYKENYKQVLILCEEAVVLQNLIFIMDIIKDEKIKNVFFSKIKNE